MKSGAEEEKINKKLVGGWTTNPIERYAYAHQIGKNIPRGLIKLEKKHPRELIKLEKKHPQKNGVKNSKNIWVAPR